MITYGNTDKKFYCFTKDAAQTDYPILYVELVKKLENNKQFFEPEVRDYFSACASIVGEIEVVLP